MISGKMTSDHRLNRCCIVSCPSTIQTSTLYTFPREITLRYIWINMIESRTCSTWNSSTRGSRLKKICQLHFEEKFIRSDGRRFRHAVPTLFTQDEIRSRIPPTIITCRTNIAYPRFAHYTNDKDFNEGSETKFRRHCVALDHSYSYFKKVTLLAKNNDTDETGTAASAPVNIETITAGPLETPIITENLEEAIQESEPNSSFDYDDDADNASAADCTPEEQEIEIKTLLETDQNYRAADCPDPLDINPPSIKSASRPLIKENNIPSLLKRQEAVESPEKKQEIANYLQGRHLYSSKNISVRPTTDLSEGDKVQKSNVNSNNMRQKKVTKKVAPLKPSEFIKILPKPPSRESLNPITLQRADGPTQTKKNVTLPPLQSGLFHGQRFIKNRKQLSYVRLDLSPTPINQSLSETQPDPAPTQIQQSTSPDSDDGPTQTKENAPRPDRDALIKLQKQMARELIAKYNTNLAPAPKKQSTSASPVNTSTAPLNELSGQRSKVLKSPNEIDLTKRLRITKARLSKAQLEMRGLRKKVKQIDSIKSPLLKSLIECTLRNQKYLPRAKRWSKCVRKFAVDIFNKSPLVYSDLEKVFDLPISVRYRKKLRNMDTAVDDDQTDVREPIMDEERISTMLLKQMSTINKKADKDMLIAPNMKIVIRGDRKVGKSCLLQRLQGGPFTEDYVQTDEIQVAPIEWTSKNHDHIVKIDVWDVVDKGRAKKPPSGVNVDNQSAPSAIENDPDTPVLDASSINVYEKASGVILMLDITNYQSFEYVVKELSLVPPELPVVILGNHCDMQHHRQVHAYHIEAALHQTRQNREAPVRYAETSMRNGFGLRLLHKFLSVPFLRLQRACLLDQLHRNQREIEHMEREIDRLEISQEGKYARFVSRLAKYRRQAASGGVTNPSVAIPVKVKPQAIKRKQMTPQQKTPPQKKPRKFMYPELLKPTRPPKPARQYHSTMGRSRLKARAATPEEYHMATDHSQLATDSPLPATRDYAYDTDSELAVAEKFINTLEDIEDELSMTIIESTTSTKLPVNRNHNEQSNIRQKSLKSVQVKKGANRTGPSLSMPSLDHSLTDWDGHSREKGPDIVGKAERQHNKKKRTGVGDC